MPIIESLDLKFEHYMFKYDNHSKFERALEIIDEKYPDVTEVEFFDDMIEHVDDFKRGWNERPNIKFTIHHVKPTEIITYDKA